VREIFDGHLVELRCTGVAALPLHLLIYIHGVLGTVAITPQQIPPQFTHTTLYTHSPHAHAAAGTSAAAAAGANRAAGTDNTDRGAGTDGARVHTCRTVVAVRVAGSCSRDLTSGDVRQAGCEEGSKDLSLKDRCNLPSSGQLRQQRTRAFPLTSFFC
jgi:hypothetical protein